MTKATAAGESPERLIRYKLYLPEKVVLALRAQAAAKGQARASYLPWTRLAREVLTRFALGDGS